MRSGAESKVSSTSHSSASASLDESSVKCDSSVDHFGVGFGIGFGNTIVGESGICSDSRSGSGFGFLFLEFGISTSTLRFGFSGLSFVAAAGAEVRILA